MRSLHSAILALLIVPAFIAAGELRAEERKLALFITGPDDRIAISHVSQVLASSGLKSSLPDGEIRSRLAKVLRWTVKDYLNSGDLRLLSALPSGSTALNKSAQAQALQKTYWLTDNALYGAAAFRQYAPELADSLEKSRVAHQLAKFPSICPAIDSEYVVGRIPAYEAGGRKPATCEGIPTPPAWSRLRHFQLPPATQLQELTRGRIVIGTESVRNAGGAWRMSPLDGPRDLFAYGCLRQVALGHQDVAGQMFRRGLDSWDGDGFLEGLNDPARQGTEMGLVGAYFTRDLDFALMCANALSLGKDTEWQSSGGKRVQKALVESRLWSAQAPDGGIYDDYCGTSLGAKNNPRCRSGRPGYTKETNEGAPLVLLAYGRNIWRR